TTGTRVCSRESSGENRPERVAALRLRDDDITLQYICVNRQMLVHVCVQCSHTPRHRIDREYADRDCPHVSILALRQPVCLLETGDAPPAPSAHVNAINVKPVLHECFDQFHNRPDICLDACCESPPGNPTAMQAAAHSLCHDHSMIQSAIQQAARDLRQ